MEFHIAPMKNITCWAFRATCAAATDSYTEMIQLNDLLAEKIRATEVIDLYKLHSQHQWIQVLTNSVEDMQKFPKFLNTYKELNPMKMHVYGININAGCPDPNIIAAGQGAALLKRSSRLVDMIKNFLANPDTKYHINVKLRLGMTEKDVKTLAISDTLKQLYALDDTRISPPILHFKHAQQSSSQPPLWDLLDDILEIGFPIIINGDIETPQDLEKLEKNLLSINKGRWNKQIRGIMIGRALIKNPYLFSKFLDKSSRKNNAISWQSLLSKNLATHPPLPRFLHNLQ